MVKQISKKGTENLLARILQDQGEKMVNSQRARMFLFDD